MAQLTLMIPDAAVPRIGAAFKVAYPALEGTDAQIVKQALTAYIKGTVKEHEGNVIAQSADEQTLADTTANNAEVEAIPIA